MKRWLLFTSGVTCIIAPSALLGYYSLWLAYWWFGGEKLIGQFDSAQAGFRSFESGPATWIGLLMFAAAGSALGGWLVRKSHGEDNQPHSLFGNSLR